MAGEINTVVAVDPKVIPYERQIADLRADVLELQEQIKALRRELFGPGVALVRGEGCNRWAKHLHTQNVEKLRQRGQQPGVPSDPIRPVRPGRPQE